MISSRSIELDTHSNPHSQRWSLPELPLDLHHGGALMGKVHLTLFIEAGFLEILNKPGIIISQITQAYNRM